MVLNFLFQEWFWSSLSQNFPFSEEMSQEYHQYTRIQKEWIDIGYFVQKLVQQHKLTFFVSGQTEHSKTFWILFKGVQGWWINKYLILRKFVLCCCKFSRLSPLLIKVVKMYYCMALSTAYDRYSLKLKNWLNQGCLGQPFVGVYISTWL